MGHHHKTCYSHLITTSQEVLLKCTIVQVYARCYITKEFEV